MATDSEPNSFLDPLARQRSGIMTLTRFYESAATACAAIALVTLIEYILVFTIVQGPEDQSLFIMAGFFGAAYIGAIYFIIVASRIVWD